MKAIQADIFKSNNKSNNLKIPRSEQNHYSQFDPDNYANEPEKQNLLNMPIRNIFENGGRNYNIPNKRNYKDIYLSNININPIINNNNNPSNRNDFRNRNSINFVNQPGLIKNILRNENLVNNNLNTDDNTINNNLINNEQNYNLTINRVKRDNFNINNNINNSSEEEKEKEEEKNKETSEENSRKKSQKKIDDEYTAIEKILKDEQILFLNDNYHISNSNEYEKIPKELHSYIVSKRVNFPKEIYQSFPSSDYESSDNYSVIYPPINCIIFVQRNILTFFNYINESSYIYNDFMKPVKKLLIALPKPGMFKSEVKFIIICVLDGEIQLLTLQFRNDEEESPIIHKTDFIFSFKETVIDLISTSKYRIFMSTLNNKIYELDYSIKQNNYFNFFGPRNTLEAISKEKPIFFGLFTDLKYIFKQSIEIIHKLKVDNTRNILYAIKYTIPKSEINVELDKVIDSSVIVFDLGIDGKGFSKIVEISQEDLNDSEFDFYGYNAYSFPYNEADLNENDILIRKSNTIIDITPLTRDKFKEYHLLIMKRNGNKIFIRFNTYSDDTNIKNQDEILKFNSSAFYRERITERFISSLKKMPKLKYNKYNNRNNNNLYDIIKYFPFTTFCFSENKEIGANYKDKYQLKAIEDDFSFLAENENIIYFNPTKGLKEKEETIFSSISKEKRIYSIIKLTDYSMEDSCGLRNLLKNSNSIYVSNNIKYMDNISNEIVSYNCMNEYSKQLFYAPEEYAILFSDEFVIYKRLRPIDTLIEIIQFKNFPNNNILNEKDNSSINNDIVNNSANDINTNLISNDGFNNMRRRASIQLVLEPKYKINNPFQVNRDKIIAQKFQDFIDIHGYIETTVMLLNIITNDNLIYYIKNKIEEPNLNNNIDTNVKDINFDNIINNNIINNSNSNINENNLIVNNSREECFTPYSLIKLKNEIKLMEMGTDFLKKIFVHAQKYLNSQISQYHNLLKTILNNKNLDKDLLLQNKNNNNLRFKIDNEFKNNLPVNDYNFETKNFMSYGFILYLSRIARLFWEEHIFVRNKLYYQEDNFEFVIVDNLNQSQIMFIKNMLIKFLLTINQHKLDLLQHASDITSIFNKFKNYLNDVETFTNNNSEFAINEAKKILTEEQQNIITEHKKKLKYFLAIFDFEKFNDELDVIVRISKRLIEILNFLEAIYKINITNELKQRKNKNILNVKIKDIYKGNYPFIINELLQIIFEFYLKEKNIEFASNKIQEIIEQCPNIVNKKIAYAIEGNFILKNCNCNEMDNIDKIKYIKEAIEKIDLNLLSINIEEVVNYLSKFEDIKDIINFCLKKGKLLQPEINKNIDKEPNKLLTLFNNDITLFNDDEKDNEEEKEKEKEKDINEIQTENNVTEFYKCITIILNILNYLHKSIVSNSFEKYIKMVSPNQNIFAYPIYIVNLLSDKNPIDYINMENTILNMVFNKEYEYIHYNIIEYLKENKMLNKLQEVNSESVEKYLNNQINLNNNSPQSLYSMFDFYFKNKNYSCATKILANLINYQNTSANINEIGSSNGKSYVSLDERITYVNTMLRTIELQLKNAEYIQLPEQKMKEIQEANELKAKMINIRNILNIQYEIRSYLITYINNVVNNNPNIDYNNRELEGFQTAIIKLDNEILYINDLYNNYAKKFYIFDSCISILFETKFANTNNKIDAKEVKSVYIDYFTKFDDRTLETNWPDINFDRFNRIFNTLIREKTQYQNFYNMLQNNGMKNKYRDIIPLEFIIAITENINKKLFFNNNIPNDENYYLIKLRQNYAQRKNLFWLIKYLNEQIFLPFSYIFNEYFIIYLSLNKNPIPKKNNNNNFDLISNRSNNLINNDNLSVHTFNSNNLSALNNSSYEDYGMVFCGNYSGDGNKSNEFDSKFYSIFLLLGIGKLWVGRLMDLINNSNDYYLESKLKPQDELDLKQFNLEVKKNGNLKMKNLIKEYFEELKNHKINYPEEQFESLEKYGKIIDNEIKDAEKQILDYFSLNNKKKIEKETNSDNDSENDNYRNNSNILKINFVGENNNYNPFTNQKFGGFVNLMGK